MEDNSYDFIKNRGKSLDAVEWAGRKFASQLKEYVAIHEIGPEIIVVKNKDYCPNPCTAILEQTIRRMGLGSKVRVFSNGGAGELVFDLDAKVEEYFQREDSLLD